MTISRKLVLTLGFTLFALLFVGGAGIWQQSEAQIEHEAMLDVIFPSLDDINSAQHGLANVRVGVRDLLVAENEVESAAALKKIDGGKKHIDAAITDYQTKHIYNPEDQRKLNAVRDAIQRYWETIQPLITARGSQTHSAEVQTLMHASPLAHAAEKALDDHYVFNKQLTVDDMQKSRQDYERGRNLSLLGIALVLVLAGGVSVQLYRTIRGGLSQLCRDLHTVSETLDFTHRIDVLRRDEIGEANEALNHLMNTLQQSLKDLHSVAEEVGLASQELNGTAQQVATAASVQSESASSMAATVQQMTVSINHVAEQSQVTQAGAVEATVLVASGSEIIRQTIGDIHEISGVVKASVGHIQQLATQSAQVEAVVHVIRDVADQTNLLALNAAIEAARAGEQGRGFAVVADEVRKLAERTAKSTQEIAGTIDSMIAMAQQTVEQMESADQLIETGVARADKASHAIGEIGENAEKAASSIAEISAAIQQQGVASNTIAVQVEQSAQMSEESSAAAQNTAANARQLDGLVKRQLETLAQFRV